MPDSMLSAKTPKTTQYARVPMELGYLDIKASLPCGFEVSGFTPTTSCSGLAANVFRSVRSPAVKA